MLQVLLKAMKSSDWSQALDFLSPAFFEVVPTLAMGKLMGTLTRHYTDPNKAIATRSSWQAIFARDSLGHRVLPRLSLALSSAKRPEKEARALGQALLSQYFANLLHDGDVFLDLRSQSFARDEEGFVWQPAPWIYAWKPDFRRAMAQIYEGYYADRPELFDKGLKALDLLHARQLFVEQFGDGRQDAVLFDLKAFQNSFHKIFLSCKEHGTRLHPDFFPLGMLLFSLYQHAEQLDLPLSPRAAYQSVRQHPQFKAFIASLD